MAFAGAVALGVATYIGLDIKATADTARLKSEVFAASQRADELYGKGQRREALDSYELVVAKGRTSGDAEVKEKVEAATDKSARLRLTLKDELAKEDADRRQREEEEHAKEEKKRLEEEERRKAALAEMEAQKRLEAEHRAEETRKLEAIKAYASPPAAARTALNAIKKLNARTEVGINYRDYGTVVGETWAEVKVFVESPEGEQLEDFSKLLVGTVDKYRLALDIWRGKIDGDLEYDKTLADVLLQECWRAAGARLKVAEGLLGGDKVETYLSSAVEFDKIDTKYETEIKTIQIELIGFRYSKNQEAITKEIIEKIAALRAREPSVK